MLCSQLCSLRPRTALVKGGQAIKEGVRQRVNKWRHELAPSFRSPPVIPSSSSPCTLPGSSSSLTATPASVASSGGRGGSGNSGSSGSSRKVSSSGGSSGGGRSTGGTDVLPFLIPLARLARQLEIDSASYTAR